MSANETTNNSVYTQEDVAKVDRVIKWLTANEKSRAWLSKKSSIPGGTLSQILSGKYVSSPTRQLIQLESVLAVESDRLRDGSPGYVKGSVHKLMDVVCNRTRQHQNFGVVTGYVGVGKTRFCKEYRATHPMTILVEASPNMTPGVLLTELLEMLDVAIPRGLDNKFREVVRCLGGTNYLLIVDEAERVSCNAMEYLRRIRDRAQVGVVLVGTEKLTTLIKPQHGQFDQVRSRVGMWPRTVERVTRDDADDMARAALGLATDGVLVDVPDEVLDALWAYCDGSARVLTENLIPAIKDYGIAKGTTLTAALIQQIAERVLFMARPRAATSQGGK